MVGITEAVLGFAAAVLVIGIYAAYRSTGHALFTARERLEAVNAQRQAIICGLPQKMLAIIYETGRPMTPGEVVQVLVRRGVPPSLVAVVPGVLRTLSASDLLSVRSDDTEERYDFTSGSRAAYVRMHDTSIAQHGVPTIQTPAAT